MNYALLRIRVRPRKIRLFNFEPGVTYFKSRAVSLNELGKAELAIDELETMRPVNIEKIGEGNGC